MKKNIGITLFALCAALALLTPAAAEEPAENASEPEITALSEPVKLPTPTDLIWGRDYWGYDGTDYVDRPECPFGVSCKIEENPYSELDLCFQLFRKGASEPLWSIRYSFKDWLQYPCYVSETTNPFLGAYQEEIPDWVNDYSSDSFNLSSGEYYFTAQIFGDGINYLDSDIATSESWVYTCPTEQLESPTDIKWLDGRPYIPSITQDNVYGYQIMYFFSPSGDVQNLRSPGGILFSMPRDSEDLEETIDDSLNEKFSSCGDGSYYFRIRTISNDISKIRTSSWSDLSPAYDVGDISASVKSQLQEIAADALADPREAVQALGTDNLKTALAADQGQSGGVAELLGELEKSTGISVDVQSEENFDGFDASDVSIVGAALNDVPENTSTITLRIGEPKQENPVPDNYYSTISVRFSMDLEGVQDQEKLKVPVKITLPIPESISPDRLVILHYEQDGNTHSIILPYTFQKDGKYYASFVLSEFSDFTMTQEVLSLTLDPDGGTLSGDPTVVLNINGTLDSMPDSPSRPGYSFQGWYTAVTGGSLVTTDTVFSQSGTIFARWKNETNSGSSSSGGGDSSNSGGNSITVPSQIIGGAVTVSPKNASKGATVTLTATPNTGYDLDTLTVTDASGKSLTLTDIGNGKYTFTMPGSKVNVSANFSAVVETEKPIAFTDVNVNAYYYDAVKWAVENGVTSGTSTTTFSPGASCTRAQTVTFLWRAAGSPAPKGTTMPFTDVAIGSYYYDAVMWAVEQGITSGATATTFAPDNAVTRAQVVTFLYRSVGTPTTTGSSFDDVGTGTYYEDAVQWAVEQNITNGTSSTTFSPNSNCTRGQIVTFLYRNRTA